MNAIQKIVMDLARPGVAPCFYAVQGDSASRSLAVELRCDGEPWPVPDGTQLLIRYRKGDGTGGTYDTLPDGRKAWTAQKNVLTVTLAPQICTVPGKVSMELTLIRSLQQLTTFRIAVMVSGRLQEGTDSEEYTNLAAWIDAYTRDHGLAAVIGAEISGNGHLMIKLSDETVLDAGGAIGPQGRPGRDGMDGVPGRDGADGAPGIPGRDGVDGAPGVPGRDGAPGVPGKDGAQGIPGAPGKTPAFTVGTVYTLAAESNASVTMTGSTEAPVLNFGIPRGADGPSGVGMPGKDGGHYIPTVSQRDKNTMTVAFTPNRADMTAVAAVDITLPAGRDGADGKKGADGITPRRGTDYWTEADIAQIRSYVETAILGGSW